MWIYDRYLRLLSAASFAARAHRHQLRKDHETPYVAHPFRVCLIVRQIFGIDDPEVLMAALLHDTIEDTTTDRDDLIEHFGPDVAESVAALSKDTRLPDAERESAYCQKLAQSPLGVKICKLADMFDNLIDSARTATAQCLRTIERSRKYLKALEPNLPEIALPAFKLVQQLVIETEERAFKK